MTLKTAKDTHKSVTSGGKSIYIFYFGKSSNKSPAFKMHVAKSIKVLESKCIKSKSAH